MKTSPRSYTPRKFRGRVNFFNREATTLSLFDRRGNEHIVSVDREIMKKHRLSQKEPCFYCTLVRKKGNVSFVIKKIKLRKLSAKDYRKLEAKVKRMLPDSLEEF